MITVVVLARALLAATFGLAGGAKLADREGVREGGAELGAPATLLRSLPWLLAAAELAVAAALLVDRLATIGAIAALLLLLTFTAFVIVAVARGRRPSCHCFGSLSAATVGWSTVARNGLLASIAAVVAVGGLPSSAALAILSAAAWRRSSIVGVRSGWVPGLARSPSRSAPVGAGRSRACSCRRRRSWSCSSRPGAPPAPT